MNAALLELAAVLKSDRLWGALLTLLLGLLCWVLVKRVLRECFSLLERKGRAVKDPETVLSVFKYILIVTFGAELLKVFGVDLSSLLAGLGIAGVVVGFAVQDVLKDLTMGANIMADKYYSVGDFVSIGGIRNACVISFNIKTTKLEDMDTGNIITLANRNISEATVLSDWQMLDVPAPYEESAERMEYVFQKLCERIAENKLVSACSYLGVQDLGDSAVYYRLRISGSRSDKGAIRRYALSCLQKLYEEEGISVPYPHMDVAQKA